MGRVCGLTNYSHKKDNSLLNTLIFWHTHITNT